jgi:hypothetical protein
MVNKNLITLFFLTFILSLNAQKINNLSDFFTNKQGQVKISKSKQARLKTLLGSNFNCILECCSDNRECSISKISLDIISEIEQIEKDYNHRFQKIETLKWRNSDTLAKLNLNLDTINYYSKIVKLKNKTKEIQNINYVKSKISTYLDPKLYENSDLNIYMSLLNGLRADQVEVLSYEEKLDAWEKLLEPIEEQRETRVLEEWHQFIKSQILVRWDVEKERLEKERKKEKEELENRKQKEEQQIIKEEQNFNKWKKNLRFSIDYKHKIIEGLDRCEACKEEWVLCHGDEFPELDFSKYAYPDFMKKLWEEHKNENRTVVGFLGGDDCTLLKFGKIISVNENPRRCDHCSRKTVRYYEKSKYLNKTFKN